MCAFKERHKPKIGLLRVLARLSAKTKREEGEEEEGVAFTAAENVDSLKLP